MNTGCLYFLVQIGQDQTYFTGHTKKRSCKNCSFTLLFEARVAHDMSCALQKIIMAKVSGHIQ